MKPFSNSSRWLLFAFSAVVVAGPVVAAGPDEGINVNVVNPPTAPVPVVGSISGSVSVSNTLRTQNVDDPARRPFQDSFSLQIDPGKSADKFENFAVNIPANTRLVIDHVNVLGELPVGQHLIGVNVSAFVGGSASGAFIGTTFRGTSPSGVIFGGPLDIYSADFGPGLFADPGNNSIEISAFRDATTGTGHVFVQFFGHIVPLP